MVGMDDSEVAVGQGQTRTLQELSGNLQWAVLPVATAAVVAKEVTVGIQMWNSQGEGRKDIQGGREEVL